MSEAISEAMSEAMTRTTLLVTCHPSSASLCGDIAVSVADTLRPRRGRVIVEDLHGQGFNPVVSQQELAAYYQKEVPADIAALVEHLRSAEELIFVLPVWMYHMPALLKGYFDRAWRPHVSFTIDGDAVRPLLLHVRHLTAIVCHGMSQATCDAVGDGTRLFFSQSLPSILPNLETNTRFDLFGLDTADAEHVRREIDRICRHFAA
jgi:NAD(P)H dehydrogenase (quinone)